MPTTLPTLLAAARQELPPFVAMGVLMNARVATIANALGLHLMNLCHAGYSPGYAAAALAPEGLRTAGHGPVVVMAQIGAVAVLVAWERDGRIDGLSRPARGAQGAASAALPLRGGGVVPIAFLSENAAKAWRALHIARTLGGSPA